MAQIKILVNNIQDVSHRAAAETELNVYLKTGWKVQNTHQHLDEENASLMLTTIITKEGDEKTESSKQEAVKPKENPVTKTNQQNSVNGAGEEKGKTKEGEEESEEPASKEQSSETPKGFKVKEKKETKEDPEKEKETTKAEVDKTETKETDENESEEIEAFTTEAKTSEKK